MLTGVDDTLRTIVNKAARIVNEYLGQIGELGHRAQDILVEDYKTNEYPYLILLLLYRAGLHQAALTYCSGSSLPHVQEFGLQIYQKCVTVYDGKLDKGELHAFMNHVQTSAPSEIDVAREALVSLFTGCKWVEQGHNTDFLFKYAFENDYNSWLWFHLKLASF